MSILSPYVQLNSPRGETANKKPRNRPPEQWYDVMDEDNVWRVGFCQKIEAKYKLISLDGHHPSRAAYYCQHSGQIAPIRTHTRGLTVPENGKTLRKIISSKQIESIIGKLILFQSKTNQLENGPQYIRSFIRTQLLITIDKIFNTPFEILGTIKLIDIQINKFIINVIQYYLKLLQDSKKFILVLDTNQSAHQLYNSIYQMSIIIEMILGVHKRSKIFYQSSLNRTITSEGFLDCFIKSQIGISPFKIFFKSISGLKNVSDIDLLICIQTISLFVSMCQKYQKQFVQGNKYQSTTRIIVQQIINVIKTFCEKKSEMRSKWKAKIEIISRVQTLYFKLFPNKSCILRKIIQGDIQQQKQTIRQKFQQQILAVKKSKQQEKQSQKMKELQNKISNLEATINKIQTINLHNQNITISNQKQINLPPQSTQNLGEQAFLGSLQWALQNGDINTCKKLITWRRSLLKLGRITGWQIALAVGMKTFKKKQIAPEDIIEANYDFLMKVNKA